MNTLQRVIRCDVRAMTRYEVADAAGLLKLDAMENPYGLPAPLAAELGERLSEVALNRYPASHPAALLAKLKARMGMPENCKVLLGNGSDEIISIIALACAQPGVTILAPVPSFLMYEIAARLARVEYVGVPLTPALELDIETMLQAIAVHQPAIVYIAYPNNPTGGLFPEAGIECIVRAASNALVVIDEAYQPFAKKSWLPRIAEFDNLVVMRTVSKLGLAGIRLGYLVGAPAWLDELDKVRPPYNINVLTQAVADFMLDHFGLLEAQAAELRGERDRIAAALAALPGITVFPSAGNFVLVRVPDAGAVFDALLAAGILVKNVSRMHPLLTDCLRISVGSPDQNVRLLSALETALDAR